MPKVNPVHPHVQLVHRRREVLTEMRYIVEQGGQVNLVRRENDLTLTPHQGFYNQLFMDLTNDNDLTSLSLAGSYSPIFDIIGVEFTNIREERQKFITYFGPKGTADGAPTSGLMPNPCEPPNEYEFGGTDFVLNDWTILGRSGSARDTTEIHMREYEQVQTYRIDGSPVEDDWELDMIGMVSTMLHDAQRYAIIGNKSLSAQAHGLEQLVKYNYTDSEGESAKAMDSVVIDWNENPICTDDLLLMNPVTVNGVAVSANYQLIDYINSWVRRTAWRIQQAPRLSGLPLFAAIMPMETLAQLVACYVCYVVCGSDDIKTVFVDSKEARAERARLMQDLGSGSVTLNFEGYPITFYPYEYELVDGVTNLSDMYFFVTRVGSQPLMRFQLKDMNKVVASGTKPGRAAIDGGRILTWSTWDNLCEQHHARMEFRMKMWAPWAAMRISNVAVSPILGHISGDPLSPFFFENNLRTFPAA